MAKQDFTPGTSTVEDFFYWINERHAIYLNRLDGMEEPWTEDEILQKWKFTNAFRELDRGTVALHKWIRDPLLQGVEPGISVLAQAETMFLNFYIYRIFNFWEHARDFGPIRSWIHPGDDLERFFRYLYQRREEGGKCFTSAHMSTSSGCELYGYDKIALYEAKIKQAIADELLLMVVGHPRPTSMEEAFHRVIQLPLCGPFVSYEIVCDMRHCPCGLFWQSVKMEDGTVRHGPEDVMTWANMGPGCKRGLQRIGMDASKHGAVESMRELLALAKQHLAPHVLCHLIGGVQPPFEIREIEHSLCEFDKYERAKRGEGSPRSKYKSQGDPI